MHDPMNGNDPFVEYYDDEAYYDPRWDDRDLPRDERSLFDTREEYEGDR